MAQSGGAFLGSYTAGDTANPCGFTVRDKATGALLNLTGATNAVLYVRKVGKSVVATYTPVMGGAFGTVTFLPGDEASLDPGNLKTQKFAIQAEFDLMGKHYAVPEGGPDEFEMVGKLR